MNKEDYLFFKQLAEDHADDPLYMVDIITHYILPYIKEGIQDDLTFDLSDIILDYSSSKSTKIESIKRVKDRTGWSLIDCKLFVEGSLKNFPVEEAKEKNKEEYERRVQKIIQKIKSDLKV